MPNMTPPPLGTQNTDRGKDYITIWDVFVRIWHWLTVGLLPAMWATAELNRMDLHIMLGIAFAGLLTFRIFWGFFGSSTAKFSSFAATPARTITYLRTVFSSAYKPPAGHSPIGGLSALALILALGAQIISGLFAMDTDGLHSGPLARFISYADARLAGNLHEIAFNILLALIALHLSAILFYTAVKRAGLIGPMLTGKRKASATQEGAQNAVSCGPLAVLLSLAISAGVSLLLYAL